MTPAVAAIWSASFLALGALGQLIVEVADAWIAGNAYQAKLRAGASEKKARKAGDDAAGQFSWTDTRGRLVAAGWSLIIAGSIFGLFAAIGAAQQGG